MKSTIVIISLFVLSPWATAELLEIMPDGWAQDSRNDVIVLTAPSGKEMITLSEHTGSNTKSVAANLFKTNLPATAKILLRKQNKREQTVIDGGAYDKGSGPVGLLVVATPRAAGGHLAFVHEFDPNDKTATQRMLDMTLELVAMAKRNEKLPLTEKSPPATATTSRLPSKAASRHTKVKAYVFDLTYVYGIGGGVYPKYKPVVLFTDGTACECLGQAVEDIDIASVLRDRPKKVGRWRQSGRDYVIDWGGERKQKTIKGKVAPPQILSSDHSLQGSYQSIGGDGNTAIGGNVMTAAVKDLTFYPDGSFEQSNQSFASSSAGTGWSKRGKSGSWSLQDSTLTLSYLDGKTVRTSLFFAAKSDAPDPLRVLWIGGKDYKRRK